MELLNVSEAFLFDRELRAAEFAEVEAYFAANRWPLEGLFDLGEHKIQQFEFHYLDSQNRLVEKRANETADGLEESELPNGFKVFKNPDNYTDFNRDTDHAIIIAERALPEEDAPEITEREIWAKRDGQRQLVKLPTYESSITTKSIKYGEPYPALIVRTSFGIMAFMHESPGMLIVYTTAELQLIEQGGTVENPQNALGIKYKMLGDPDEFIK